MRNEILPGMEDPGTIFSPCGNYRYRLERKFAEVDSAVLLRWILMNPSLADTFELDNTLKIVAELTRAWGYFGFVVLNLKAFVSPYPEVLDALGDAAIGPDNDRYILEEAAAAPTIVCAWGAHPSFHERANAVLQMLAPHAAKLRCLQKTAGGHPHHPLYLPKAGLRMQPFP